MEDVYIERICEQISSTLAKEREAACQAAYRSMRAELQVRHQEVVRDLTAQLRLLPEGPLAAKGLGPTDVDVAGNPSPDPINDNPNTTLNSAASTPNGTLNSTRIGASQQDEEIEERGASKPSKEPKPGTMSATLNSTPSPVLAEKRPAAAGGASEASAKTSQQILHGNRVELQGSIKWINLLVKDNRFEAFVTLMILLSIIAIAFEVQITGLDTGYQLGFGSVVSSPIQTMPYLIDILMVCDLFFGVVFTSEILLKIVGFRQYFFTSFSNLLDLFCVVTWLIENTAGIGLSMNPMIVRIIRLFKVMRLFKLARTVEHLESLFLLIESIKASRSVCFWATVLLGVIQTGVGIFLNQALNNIMQDEAISMTKRKNIYKYFGTFTRSMVTMLEVTFGNFVPVCRMMQEISEWYALLIIIYNLLVGFAALRIISGIFMAETLRVANNNDQIMVMQKKRRQRETREKMTRLFKAADESGDGQISLDEFMHVFDNDTVKTWLSAQDLEISDPAKFFLEAAGDDETMTAQEMISGVVRMRGPARAIDFHHLMKDHTELKKDHQEHKVVAHRLEDQMMRLEGTINRLEFLYMEGKEAKMPEAHQALSGSQASL